MNSLRTYFYRACALAHLMKLNERLYYAAAEGNGNKVKALLEAGADVHAGKEAALMAAAHRGLSAMVRDLLGAGARVDADHFRPERLAASNGYTDTVRLLDEWSHRQSEQLDRKKYDCPRFAPYGGRAAKVG
jgi:ankyrin repeat protein